MLRSFISSFFLTFHNCFRGCYTLWLVTFLTAQNMGSPMVLALTQERRVGFAIAAVWPHRRRLSALGDSRVALDFRLGRFGYGMGQYL